MNDLHLLELSSFSWTQPQLTGQAAPSPRQAAALTIIHGHYLLVRYEIGVPQRVPSFVVHQPSGLAGRGGQWLVCAANRPWGLSDKHLTT